MNFNKIKIIAEAGVNHNGSIITAKKLIDGAAKAGADFVKFQTFTADSLASSEAKLAIYQKKSGLKVKNQYELLKKLELSKESHFELINYCKKKKIKFLSTAFDEDSLEFLKSLNLDLIKVPSGEINNYPYLCKVAKINKDTIVSTGMSDKKDISNCLKILTNNGLAKSKITLMHCNTGYPTPFEDANLKAIHSIKKIFKTNVGYSDHTVGIEAAIASVAFGAKIIEKHFTLNKNDKGPDHKASISVQELSNLVSSVKNVYNSLGSGIKKVTKSEIRNIKIVRKSIVAKKNIYSGELFNENNLTTKRPSTGLSPLLWNKVLGKKAKKNFKKNELIRI